MPTDQEMTTIVKIVCYSGRGRGGHVGKQQSWSASSRARETFGESLQGRNGGSRASRLSIGWCG